MFRVIQTTSGRVRVALCFACATLVLFVGTGVAIAEAATYHYCVGCLIHASEVWEAGSAPKITQNYVHRLAGPNGVTIGAGAQYADNYAWGSFIYSTATEVTHSYTGTRPAWGAAVNLGGGNYSFNAHVNY